MEEIFQCKLCRLEFNKTSVIPIVLPCGHSFCKLCILKSTEFFLCANCEEQINISEDSLKTNYSILEMVEEFRKIRNAESLSLQSSEIVRKCLQKEDILLKKRSEVESYLKVIDRGLSKLREVTNTQDKEINAQETEEILSNLDMDLKIYGKFICFSMCGLNVSVSISLTSFEDSQKYLCEIYKRVQNNESVYSVKQIEDCVKYGKISMRDNKLLFHCLSLSQIPKDSSLILFDELKVCKENKYFAFINLSLNEKGVSQNVFIEMFDRKMSYLFLKLCTGESGPTYKGLGYRKDRLAWNSFLTVESNEEMKKLIEYNEYECGTEFGKFQKFETEDEYLHVSPDGSFILMKYEISSQPHGKVISPIRLRTLRNYESNPSCLKIIDSGIAFEV